MTEGTQGSRNDAASAAPGHAAATGRASGLSILDYLAEQLARGPLRIGQVLVSQDFELRHVEDEGVLEVFRSPEAAAAIARFDDNGEFRPLKSAPNLRRGWVLKLSSLSETRVALDLLYPAALGIAAAWAADRLRPTDLSDTLGRQTGMYAVTKKLTEPEAEECIRATCARETRCLKRILWKLGPRVAASLQGDALDPPGVPLLCTEACPLLIEAARAAVKARPA